MAKRKADELEDFTAKHSEGGQCTKEQITEGSALLKKMLLEWKATINAAGEMSSKEKKLELKKLAMGKYKEAFEKDPFFQSVRALV